MRHPFREPALLRRLGRAIAPAVFLLTILPAAPATAGSHDANADAVRTSDATRPDHSQRADASALAGTDDHVDHEHSAETEAERDVALAATWHVGPELLVAQPTDSEATAAARLELAAISARLGEVVARYDGARAMADGAAVRAEAVQAELTEARAVAAVAATRYREDRDLLASVLVEAYTTGSTGPFGMLFSAGTDQDLVTGMMVLKEMGESQSAAVVAAQRSRDRLRVAAAAVARTAQRAEEKLEASEQALAQAEAARSRVVAELAEARALVEDSALADLVATAQALAQQATMTPEAARDFVAGDFGVVAFPLPAGAAFVDQDNWGNGGSLWANAHTGDDLSAACGTPVLAATDGTVSIRTDQSWSGRWLVMVSTGEGRLTTWYAHLQTLLVGNGDRVRAGQPIGAVGAEGNATGCHLHFEVHPFGGAIYEDNADPSAWLHAIGVHPEDS
jgi:murein DD-endopeptidase MepM/ murein hydrolase activator NlpD